MPLGREFGEVGLGQQTTAREKEVQHSPRSPHFPARPREAGTSAAVPEPAATTSGYVPWDESFVLPPARGAHGLKERVSV